MNYEIVEVDDKNAFEYSKVNILSWNQSYKGIIEQSFLDKINTKEEMDEMTKNIINSLDESKRFLLKYNDKYVGLFRIRKSKYEGYESYGELGALYLLDDVKKKGFGKILFLYAKNELKKLGYDKMIIGCLEDNPSNDFYKKMGAVFVKKYPFKIGNQSLFENVYIINL